MEARSRGGYKSGRIGGGEQERQAGPAAGLNRTALVELLCGFNRTTEISFTGLKKICITRFVVSYC